MVQFEVEERFGRVMLRVNDSALTGPELKLIGRAFQLGGLEGEADVEARTLPPRSRFQVDAQRG